METPKRKKRSVIRMYLKTQKYRKIRFYAMFSYFNVSFPAGSFSVERLSCYHGRSAWGTAKSFRRTIHRMVRPLCLLTFLGGTLRVPFGLWGLLAPTPRRKLLKKLEQNFYVLLTRTTL